MKTLIALAFAVTSLSMTIAAPAFAVDNSISTLCRAADSPYMRPGGFCDAVAAYALSAASDGAGCPPGLVRNSNGECVCEH